MESIEKRISRLESNTGDDKLRVVVLLNGEIAIDALERLGLPVELKSCVFLSPLDVDL